MEIVGVVSSAIAIEQLVASVLKLRKVVSAWRQAPVELKLLLEEAELINDLLAEVEAQRTQIYAVACPDSVWSRCIASCAKAADQLNAFANQMQKTTQTSTNLGRIRLVLGKDKIDGLRSGLERAKATLMLAQQFLLSARVEYLFTSRWEQLQCPKTQQVEQDLVLPPTEVTQSSRPAGMSSGRDPRHKRQTSLTYRYRTPTWLSQTTWEFQILRHSCAGWTFHLTPYTTVANDWPLFQLARKGGIDGIQKLISTEQKGLFVQNQLGENALHIAASHERFETCRFLLDHGLEVNARNIYSKTPLFKFSSSYSQWHVAPPYPGFSYVKRKEHDMYRLFLTHKNSEEFKSEEELVALASKVICSEDALCLIQRQMDASYTNLGLEKRVRMVTSGFPSTVEVFKLKLGYKTIPRDAFATKDPFGFDLFNFLAGIIASICSQGNKKGSDWLIVVQASLDAWHEILCDLAKDYNYLLSFQCGGHSPLITFINVLNLYTHYYETPSSAKAEVFSIVKIWLSELQKAGVDLEFYGAAEKAIFAKLCLDPLGNKPTVSYGENVFRVSSLDYGPSVDDWKLWWVEESRYDDYLAEFWHMVENPELFMPGAWPEHED